MKSEKMQHHCQLIIAALKAKSIDPTFCIMTAEDDNHISVQKDGEVIAIAEVKGSGNLLMFAVPA